MPLAPAVSLCLSRRHSLCLTACCIALLSLLVYPASAPAQDVPTWHYDNARSGVQTNETVLTPANVTASQFGKLFSLPVIGDTYAQPLYLSQYPMSDGKLHNVLIVATAQDYIYAFDADGKNPSSGYLWRKFLVNSGETWLSYKDEQTDYDIYPNIGIISTPVIDRSSGVVYVLSRSKTTSGTITFHQRLHALSIASGAEQLSGPTEIQASVPGSGDGGTTITFNAKIQNQRPALLLTPTPGVGSGKSVFLSWASHGDFGAYHGWVIAYDAANITRRNGAWVDTPDGREGGIWMSGGGPSSDDAGNIFLAAGNGTFDANTGKDHANSALRLNISSTGITLADFFTPADVNSLNASDLDMGTGAVTLLPTQAGAIPHLAVTVDKSGTIHLINRDHMGGFTTPNNSSVQSFSGGGTKDRSSFAFFNNRLYGGFAGAPLQAWSFNPSTELFNTAPESKSGNLYGSTTSNGAGAVPSVSTSSAGNSIVWAIDYSGFYHTPGVLYAYDPANLATLLYSSNQAANSRDAAAIAVKFNTPTVANGHVYVGGRNAVTAYGLLTPGAPLTAAPTFSPAAGAYPTAQSVTLADSTPNASIYYTTDGSPASTGSTLYTGPIQVAASVTIEAVALAPGFSQSPQSIASYTIGSPGGGQTSVSLAAVANTLGIYTDGTAFTTGGLDGTGAAYSGNLLHTSLAYAGVTYTILPANQKDVIKGTGAAIPLSGSFAHLRFLGTGLGANQPSQVFTVTYTDGTTATFTQGLSDWFTPQHYTGENIALTMPYRNLKTGAKDNRPFNLYQYNFALNPAKTLKTLTLPANTHVAVVAITLTTN